ncbi:uncharacterized protein LAESUDRAFT_710542 [Laetiporus sulphureus 93-53]|uniref:Uncharacterized protein n=1 Tax=Laetiporus sulphureus 93-53 TaxID=1314785 RepID=A0A165HQA2_9APHY|nr:uncharacterized protein LAESUDRAFT_710542 [Laetiporus sulphureus 93-53]KZT12042.1 hypothetical protein LAESUDRAFT_710542 [Laetiporus sulphureus 93-53]
MTIERDRLVSPASSLRKKEHNGRRLTINATNIGRWTMTWEVEVEVDIPVPILIGARSVEKRRLIIERAAKGEKSRAEKEMSLRVVIVERRLDVVYWMWQRTTLVGASTASLAAGKGDYTNDGDDCSSCRNPSCLLNPYLIPLACMFNVSPRVS